MPKVRTADFYYGAVLSMLFNNKSNGSIAPALVEGDNDRQIYDFTTDNTEFKLFVKYRTDKQDTKTDEYSSWEFSLTNKDKSEILNFINGKTCNIVIALMCGTKNLNESEIALIGKDQIKKIINSNKTSITISRKKNEKEFRISMGGGRDKSMQIKANRFNELFCK